MTIPSLLASRLAGSLTLTVAALISSAALAAPFAYVPNEKKWHDLSH